MFDSIRMLILQGISGSGKSTFANELYLSDTQHWAIISRDKEREQLLGEENMNRYFEQGMNFAVEEEITKKLTYHMVTALKCGKSVIIDNTTLKKKYLADFLRVALDMGLKKNEVQLKRFDVDIQTATKRVHDRGGFFVSPQVIQKQYDTLRNATFTVDTVWDEIAHNYQPRKWFATPFEVIPASYNPTLPKAVICDLDGTLAHRGLLLDGYIQYRSFYDYDKCDTDTVDSLVADVIKGLQDRGYKIIFVSGRKSECRQLTQDFIKKATGFKENEYWLLMRDEKRDIHTNPQTGHIEDDSDDIVKYRLYNRYIRDNFQVVGAIDDRKRVVALWEQLGLRVLNVGLLNEEF